MDVPSTMRALVYTAPHRVELRDVPTPHTRPEQALIRVECAGICGSDLAGFEGRSTRRQPPLILGHEVVGRVVSAPVGASVSPGERVVANPLQTCGVCPACRHGHDNICSNWRLLGMDDVQGAFADYVAVDAANLTSVPDMMQPTAALMVEPLANSVHVLGLAEAGRFQSLAIIGGGTQGVLALALARLLGHRDIAVVESHPDRRTIAAELGASLVINPAETDPVTEIRAWSDGGVDVAIEAVGIGITRSAAVASVRKGGTVIMLGLHDQSSELDFAGMVRNEIALKGSFAYTSADFSRALRLLVTQEIDPTPYVSVMPLDDGQEAFRNALHPTGRTLKIALSP
ncbi:MAG: alcohol dehydrogenase catalytic domain-containing protein [Chthonomonadales bacterium]|nr:alcohol dehydrogenase catalytic domain-containing protein [Chthonomonadales bacterium]